MNKTITYTLLIVLGLLGLYAKAEYSGWVLFIGVIGIIFEDGDKDD